MINHLLIGSFLQLMVIEYFPRDTHWDEGLHLTKINRTVSALEKLSWGGGENDLTFQ